MCKKLSLGEAVIQAKLYQEHKILSLVFSCCLGQKRKRGSEILSQQILGSFPWRKGKLLPDCVERINCSQVWSRSRNLACVSQKTRKLYKPEKLFVKLRPAYSVTLVFSHVVKGIKIKITAKFRDAEHLRLEDTRRIMSPEKFLSGLSRNGTFEKRAPEQPT